MSKSLKTAGWVFYNLLVVVVAIAAAEYATRAYVSARRGRGRQQISIVLDRWSGYRISSNFDRTGVHHNAQGFRRDQDVEVTKPANTVRIFLMGGSTAYGSETVYPEATPVVPVSNRETIDYFLEQRLNAAFSSRHWEVINAGVSGFGLHQDLARILSVVLRYQPDAIVLLDGVNDLDQLIKTGPRYDPYEQTGFGEEFNNLTDPHGLRALGVQLSTWLTRNSVMYRVLENRLRVRSYRRYRRERENRIVPAGLKFGDLSPEEQAQFKLVESQLDYYRQAVRRIHRILALDGIEDIFLLQPTIRVTKKPLVATEPRLAEFDRAIAGRLTVYTFENLYPAMAKQLAQDAPAEGYNFLDLTGVFDGMNAQAFTDYCHLTPAGNREIADGVFEFISRNPPR